MSSFNILAIVVTMAAVFSYLNHRHFRLPTTIALMIMSLALSLGLLLVARVSPWADAVDKQVWGWLEKLSFSKTFLGGILGFFLFAGALRINLEALVEHWLPIAVLAVIGTTVSTILVGTASWLLERLWVISLPLSYCLLFGALISPTDPIAVLNLFKVRRVPWSLEATMAGESLFNDGVAVVMFSVLLEVVRMGSSGEAVSAGHVLVLFARQSAGGILLGLALGFVVFQLLKRIDSYPLEISITIAAVMGGYALAEALDTSGPLSMVAAGILVGNQGKSFAMSETTRRNLEVFWEVVDELLNAVLFVMIGLEALLISLKPGPLVAGLVLIPIVLLSRLLTAGLPIRLLRGRFRLPRGSALFLTWCGLRGGISIALALSLPPGPERSVIVLITYVIVVFAIIVQGLSAGRLLRMLRLEHPKNGLDDRTEP